MNIDTLFEDISKRNEESATEYNRLSDLATEVSGIRNQITFLESEINHLLKNPEYDPEYPELLKTIQWELVKMLDSFPERFRVVVEVTGGVAEVTTCPDQIDVEIIDHDNEARG